MTCDLILARYVALAPSATFAGPASDIQLGRIGGQATLALPAPTNPDENGRILNIITTTAFPHIITGPITDETGFNRTSATFSIPAPAIGLNMTLRAAGGRWYVVSQRGALYA